MLGIAEGAVKSRCARGRAELAKDLVIFRKPDADANVPVTQLKDERTERGAAGGTMTDSTRGTEINQDHRGLSMCLPIFHATALDRAESARALAPGDTSPSARAVWTRSRRCRPTSASFCDVPVEAMPAQFAARLDAALQAEMRSADLPRRSQPPPEVRSGGRPCSGQEARPPPRCLGSRSAGSDSHSHSPWPSGRADDGSTGGAPQAQYPPAQTETPSGTRGPSEPLALDGRRPQLGHWRALRREELRPARAPRRAGRVPRGAGHPGR